MWVSRSPIRGRGLQVLYPVRLILSLILRCGFMVVSSPICFGAVLGLLLEAAAP
jgi:hypothetical protein